MKKNRTLCVLVMLCALLIGFTSCGSELHNGTEMAISKVTVTGLPAKYYNTDLLFTYVTNDGSWVHDGDNAFKDQNTATVDANGLYTLTFSPALVTTTPVFTFIMVGIKDHAIDWDNTKFTTSFGGPDAEIDNTWTGSAAPKVLTGVVSGDAITWTLED